MTWPRPNYESITGAFTGPKNNRVVMFLPEPDLPAFILKYIDLWENLNSRLGTYFEYFIQCVVLKTNTSMHKIINFTNAKRTKSFLVVLY